MTWPEYLQGYAGLGILLTPLQPYKGCQSSGGKQMHLSIEGRKQGQGELHGGDKKDGSLTYLLTLFEYKDHTDCMNTTESFTISQTCVQRTCHESPL